MASLGNGIRGASQRAGPFISSRFEAEITRAQMRRLSVGIYVSAGGVRINRAILAANVKEHHFRLVIELEAQPIPAGLVGFKLMGEEFMVHPTGTGYFHFPITELDWTGGRQAR